MNVRRDSHQDSVETIRMDIRDCEVVHKMVGRMSSKESLLLSCVRQFPKQNSSYYKTALRLDHDECSQLLESLRRKGKIGRDENENWILHSKRGRPWKKKKGNQ